jgi:curved DNA-binding protein CbpA
MDPHLILGVQSNATQEEIKQAYRRLAMKWHPDRNQNSGDAKERFHRAAEAYKILFEKAPKEIYGKAETTWSDDSQANGGQESARYDSDQTSASGSNGEFADTVFWDVMLDYGIKLAQTGMSQKEIALDICRNGCNENLARLIAEKAFNIHAHYTSNPESGKQRKSRSDRRSFDEERLDGELYRAFIGQRSFFWSPRDATDYYLVVFRAFSQSTAINPLSWISANKRLMRILNFSIVLFAVLLLAVYYYPGPAEYKLLSDKQMLQLPFLVLPLMIVWMLYRKLWVATLVLSLVYMTTIAYYNDSMWLETPLNLFAMIPIVLICFAPFVFTAVFANYIYYQKAQRMRHKADQLFTDHLDQLVWIKNRSGTSATAAFLFALVFIVAMVYLFPRNWDYSAQPAIGKASVIHQQNQATLKKVRLKVDDAREFFRIGEAHFHASPADYVKAEMAYITSAANGSLLAFYRLGYMHYSGEGTEQNDTLAFDYFLQATQAPLAFQPHDLELTTRFLGESYNSLGIMYQGGLGTRKNLGHAVEMYRKAEEFGSSSARRNLNQVYRPDINTIRPKLANPRLP